MEKGKEKGWFVTGTDTGAGKTVVTAALTSILRGNGIDAVPMKPVQTGCALRDGKLVAHDLEFCLSVTGIRPDPAELDLMSPFRFEPACSPHLAASMAGKTLSVAGILKSFRALAGKHPAVIVEGAGGVLVPLSESETMLDLIRAIGLPVIVSARAGLGTINHTMLTLNELRRASLEVAGVVFTTVDVGDDPGIVSDNRAVIERMGKVQVLGVLPHSRKFAEMAKYPDAFRMWSATHLALPGQCKCSCCG